jgi:hypothetical protein
MVFLRYKIKQQALETYYCWVATRANIATIHIPPSTHVTCLVIFIVANFCYIDCAAFFEKNLDNNIFLLAILEMENVKIW